MKIDDKFGVFNGKMFCVWEVNHRVSAWMRHVSHFHLEDPNWHNMVPCISLDSSNYVGILLVPCMTLIGAFSVPPSYIYI